MSSSTKLRALEVARSRSKSLDEPSSSQDSESLTTTEDSRNGSAPSRQSRPLGSRALSLDSEMAAAIPNSKKIVRTKSWVEATHLIDMLQSCEGKGVQPEAA